MPHSTLHPASQALEQLNAEHIHAALSTAGQAMLAHLVCHEQLDSTNAELLRQAAAGAPSPAACLAERQTAGRGRRGREWVSPFGNLYLSLLWRSPLPAAALGGTSLVAGAVTTEVLQALGAQHLSLKWPNDLLWHGQKLAGLLLEVGAKSSTTSTLVIGIGINLLTSATKTASSTNLGRRWIRCSADNQSTAICLQHNYLMRYCQRWRVMNRPGWHRFSTAGAFSINGWGSRCNCAAATGRSSAFMLELLMMVRCV
ncbi:biotin--[acetyl-CoA-carboxylase] ligase [Chromatium okenii]|uniref:biotin--[acetyl-CoA-carboxylase] ligase n=1 Tax=Chromatium okenii TaxID=61644 RepID=UPI001F5B8FDB|nr:biotin--[acetyl-CoA-carboxylase] ligase [Chromatium okenii]